MNKYLSFGLKGFIFLIAIAFVVYATGTANPQTHKTTEVTSLNASITDLISKNIYYYNQSTGSFNSTYSAYAYNQTQPILTDFGKWFYNMTTGTFNATYDSYSHNQSLWIETIYGKWFYNQTTGIVETLFLNENVSLWQAALNKYNATYNTWSYNQSDGSYNETYNKYAYNQTDASIVYVDSLNSSYLSTYNATYAANMANNSWNQTLGNLLYADIKWGYNQSDGSYNATYDIYAYNMTTPAIDYTDALNDSYEKFWYNYSLASGSVYNSSYDAGVKWQYNETYSGSTFNSTYDTYAYNMSDGSYNATYDMYAYNMTTPAIDYADGLVGGNATFNQSLTDLLYANIKWAYNQSDGSYNATYDTYAYNMSTSYNETYHQINVSYNKWWYNYSLAIGSTYNATYNTWAYNMSDGSYNSTYATYAYNMSTSYNETYHQINVSYNKWWYNYSLASGSTYNATYNTWSYNQTSPAISSLNTTYSKFWYNFSLASGSTYNETYHQINVSYNKWWYNYSLASGLVYNSSYDAGVKWQYNQTNIGTWAYNQTTPAISYVNTNPNNWQNYSTGITALNVTSATNVTVGDKLVFTGQNKTCYNGPACTAYTFWNGTTLITQT